MTLSTIFQFLPRNFLNKNILISVLGLLLLCFVFFMFSETIEERYGLLLGLSKQKNEILTILGVGMGGVLLTLFRKYVMEIFTIFLVVVLGLLFVGFVSVMFSETVEQRVGPLLGLSEQKNEILTFLGIGMGGMLIALQALMSYRRAKAMEDTANAQVKATEEQAKANQNTENGLRQERLKNAIEHLGNDSDSVRLGGAYELFHLAQDTKKEALQRMRSSGGADERFHLAQDTPDLRQTVLDILCAHIRRTTGEDEYRKTHQSKPSQEVQSLLTLLFVQDHNVFKGLHINLQESWLNGADLKEARLQNANLTGVYLLRAYLSHAQLQRANLEWAQLQGVGLWGAQLQEAKLLDVQLQGANLHWVQLQRANLEWARLQGANLMLAQLQGAGLQCAQLQGADLRGAQLQGADLTEAQLQGADLTKAHLQGAGPTLLADPLLHRTGQQSDLSTVIFEGGLTKEKLDFLVEGSSVETARELRSKLEPHIGKPPSHELPAKSGAVTGAYTKEEAEEWIAEYEKAMPEVSTADG